MVFASSVGLATVPDQLPYLWLCHQAQPEHKSAIYDAGKPGMETPCEKL